MEEEGEVPLERGGGGGIVAEVVVRAVEEDFRSCWACCCRGLALG